MEEFGPSFGSAQDQKFKNQRNDRNPNCTEWQDADKGDNETEWDDIVRLMV